MFYLISQMLFCLLIAFILGFLVGLLFCKLFCKGKKTIVKAQADNDDDHIIPAFIDAEDVDADMVDLDNMTDIDSDQNLDDSDYTIDRLEGVGPRTAALFAKVGVNTIGDYLRKLYTPDAREDVAKELEIKAQPIHDWASMADLMRVDGVDHQYAELLYVSGIQTTGQLADSEAATLTPALAQVNADGKQRISPEDPSLDMVEHWITRARDKKDVVQV